MNSVWVLSIVLQWGVIGALCILVLSLVRQLGLINLRIERSERPASQPGPAIGTTPLAYDVPLASGDGSFALGGRRAQPQLLVFLAPDCGPCKQLPDALRRLDPRAADVLVALSMDREPAGAYLASGRLDGIGVALLADLPGPYYVPMTPMAIVIAPDGKVVSRGHPRSLADLEGLLAAASGDAQPSTREPILEVIRA